MAYIERLTEDLREDDEIDVDEDTVEEALEFLTYSPWKLGYVLPIHDWVKEYVLNRDGTRAHLDFLKRLNELHYAFQKLVLLNPRALQDTEKETNELLSMPESPQKHVRMVDLVRSGKFSLLKTLGLKTLNCHISEAANLVAACSSLWAMDRPRALPSHRFGHYSGLLLRAALETALKGMLLEHMCVPAFRTEVGRKQWSGTYFDTVLSYLNKAEWKSHKWGLSLEETIILIGYQKPSDQKAARLGFRDTVHWLLEWEAFKSVPDAENRIARYYDKLSRIVHMDIYERFARTATTESRPALILEEVTDLVDIIIVGALNTAKNVNRNGLFSLLGSKADTDPDADETAKTVCIKSEEIASAAGLSLTLNWLESALT